MRTSPRHLRECFIAKELAALVWLLAGVSCSTPMDVVSARVLSAELTTPVPLVRVLHLELDRAADLMVEYWTDGDAPLHVLAPASLSTSATLTRLRPARTYHYRVVGADVSGTFTSDTVPADLANSFVSSSGARTAPLLMVHLYDPAGFKGYAITDVHGDVVWYWRTTDFSYGMTRRSNGNFVVMDKGRGLVEITPGGTVVHELAQDVVNREMHHDVIASTANTLLFIAFDDRVVNGVIIRGDAIWEWTPETGAVAKRWSSWDFFSLSDTPSSSGGEWLHANALSLGPTQNVLLGIHHWNQVISISPDWRTVQWRLGGPGATYTVAASEAFSGQHTPRVIAGGHLLMFDNGTARGTYSRAVEYALDGTTAHTVWEWRSQPLNFAGAVGSARRLDNGNTMVAFGMPAGLAGSTGPTEVYEVTPTGTAVWHLVTRTQTMFRAEPLTSVGAESSEP